MPKIVSTPQVIATITADLASVSANAGDTIDFTVPGARVGHIGFVVPDTDIDGLSFSPGKVTAADTLSIPVNNSTGSPINPSEQTFSVVVL